jgi:hypothetical protein
MSARNHASYGVVGQNYSAQQLGCIHGDGALLLGDTHDPGKARQSWIGEQSFGNIFAAAALHKQFDIGPWLVGQPVSCAAKLCESASWARRFFGPYKRDVYSSRR